MLIVSEFFALRCSRLVVHVIVSLSIVAMAGSTAEATIVVNDFSGVFINPVGGTVNQGVGTNFFLTGQPVPDANPNSILFDPFNQVTFHITSPFLPSIPVKVGEFHFENGVTELGTSASKITLDVSATATNNNFQPPAIGPVGLFKDISLIVTPNLTGNAILDSDIWGFEGLGTAVIAEGASGALDVYGRLVPREFASPPQRYDFEITSLLPTDPDNTGISFSSTPRVGLFNVFVPSVPEPSSSTLLITCLLSFGILCRNKR